MVHVRMGRRNIEKHNVNFEGAATMFGGVTLSRIAGREDYGEVRDISIGRVAVDTDVSSTQPATVTTGKLS
jgi:uncharacterized DUF497 family protein